MHSGAAIAEASMRRQGKTLAEVVSGDPRTLCTRALEAAVSEIRGSSGWIQRIVQGRRIAQQGQEQEQRMPVDAADDDLPQRDGCLVVQCRDRDAPEWAAGCCGDASDKEHDMVPLVDRFAGGVEQQPNAACSGQPTAPRQVQWVRLAALVLVQAGLVAYLGALCGLLRPRSSSPFAWHPVLMSTALTMATEGVVAVQHLGGRRAWAFHCCAHGAGGVALLAGVAMCCGDRRRDSVVERAPAHGAVGVLALLLAAGQAVFALLIACRARGGLAAAQRTAAYRVGHRALGYAALALLWAAAWLGVHARWLQAAGSPDRRPSEWLWRGAFAALAIGVLAPAAMSRAGRRGRIS
ncbi:hypothetical protein H4R19_000259 [Coemansia spiralis]|nr:hypothetical protein H4R19_000259 [Coemansia spiralis]